MPLTENHRIHEYLTKGIRSVVYTDEYGAEQNPTIRLIDRREPDNNDFLAANQVTVIDGDHKRRFDIVLYVNGMPLGVVELKKAGDENADLKGAHAPAHDVREGAAAGVPLQCGVRGVATGSSALVRDRVHAVRAFRAVER